MKFLQVIPLFWDIAASKASIFFLPNNKDLTSDKIFGIIMKTMKNETIKINVDCWFQNSARCSLYKAIFAPRSVSIFPYINNEFTSDKKIDIIFKKLKKETRKRKFYQWFQKFARYYPASGRSWIKYQHCFTKYYHRWKNNPQ